MISDHLPNIKGLILDMDGVLWKDTEPIGDLPAIFQAFNDQGLKVILATNNGTKTVDEFFSKIRRFGVELEDWQVISAAQATAIHLTEKYPNGCKVYAVGTPSLVKILEDAGLTVLAERSDDIQVVVAAMDTSLTYEKIKNAELLVRNGAEFIGTNPDVTYPSPDGLIPGAGTVIGAIEIASGHKAKIIGKPEPLLYQMALRRLGLKPEETLGVGDRLETDILGAQAAGISSAFVLSGASTLEQAQQMTTPPDIILKNLSELVF
ncbi:MAG: HAD-IIA family hydrolase [Anaerolineaceae bacterium]|nr:HAD-IIA family hydrolase [Anaerolineaceae bacterium]